MTTQADVDNRFSPSYDPSKDTGKASIDVSTALDARRELLATLQSRLAWTTSGSKPVSAARMDAKSLVGRPSDSEIQWPKYSKGPREWDLDK